METRGVIWYWEQSQETWMGLTQENRSTFFWLGYRETHWGREGGEDPNKARKL
jgi:hypothetical protein